MKTDYYKMKVSNATKLVEYWERNEYDSNIHLQFTDFDEIEVYLDPDYDGTLLDAIEKINHVIYSARL